MARQLTTRRTVVAGLMLGGAGGAALLRGRRRGERVEPSSGAAPVPGSGATPSVQPERDAPGRSPPTDALVDALLASDSKGCLTVAADALARGVAPERVLTAALLLPICSRDFTDVHASAVVPGIQRLMKESVEPRQRLLPVLWAVENAHVWAGTRRRRPSPPVPDARAALVRALTRGEPGPADRAATSLAATDPEGARCILDEFAPDRLDPHAVIWASLAPLTLKSVGSYAPAVVGSVARYIGLRSAHPLPEGAAGRPAEPGLDLVESDSTTPEDIARALRSSPETSLDGLASPAIWSALAVLCLEVQIADTSTAGVGVHATTALDGLWRIWQRASLERKPLVLAAAVRRVLRVHSQARGAPSVLDLTPAPGPLFGRAGMERTTRYRVALAAVLSDRERYLAEVRRRVALQGAGAHTFKYWAAVLDLADRLGGDLATRWLAAQALTYPTQTTARWARAEEAEALLDPAGG